MFARAVLDEQGVIAAVESNVKARVSSWRTVPNSLENRRLCGLRNISPVF